MLRAEKQHVTDELLQARNAVVACREMKARLDELRSRRSEMARRFAPSGREGPELIKSVDRAASASGLAMLSVSETAARTEDDAGGNGTLRIRAVTCDVSLRGSYDSLVRFFQSLGAGPVVTRVESLNIARDDDDTAGIRIRADLAVSVLSAQL